MITGNTIQVKSLGIKHIAVERVVNEDKVDLSKITVALQPVGPQLSEGLLEMRVGDGQSIGVSPRRKHISSIVANSQTMASNNLNVVLFLLRSDYRIRITSNYTEMIPAIIW